MAERRRRPTLRDIAAETGLSTAAVSYALRGLQVPAETQQRVREAADRLGYQVNPIARALVSGRSGYVGVMCRSLADIWQQGLAAALARGLFDAGRSGLVVDSANDPQVEALLAQRLVEQRVDALIAIPVDPRAEHWATVAEQTVLVSVGDGLPGASTAAEVVFDNAGGVRDALTRLAEAGHRRIAVLTTVQDSTPDRPAEAVVRSVAADLGLTATLTSSPNDLDGAAAAALEVLRAPPGAGAGSRPSAILCLADSIAYGVYAAAAELGLRIPEDVSVVGFDDNAVSRLLTPALTTYHWPVDELVAAVVARTLLALDDDRSSSRLVITPTVRLRGSVSPP